MNTKRLNDIVTQWTVFGEFEDDVTPTEIKELLETSDKLYYNKGTSPLSDSDYDLIRTYYNALVPTDQYVVVGAPVDEIGGTKIKLPVQLGSLDQLQIDTLDFERWVQTAGLTPTDVVVLTEKLDGMSGYISVKNNKVMLAATRGDGTEGIDITAHAKHLKIPTTVDIDVRVEFIVSKMNRDNFDRSTINVRKSKYKNLRNGVAGILGRDVPEPSILQWVHVVCYEIFGSNQSKIEQLDTLKSIGFITPEYEQFQIKDLTTDKLVAITERFVASSGYELDGIVIDINDKTIRERLTTSELNPKYARKFKVDSTINYAETTVRQVVWNTSKHGYAKPKIEVDPVELDGATVTFATAFNAAFVRDNKLGPGARVGLIRSGGVIPFIKEVITPASEPQFPTESFKWNDTHVDIIVTRNVDATIAEVVEFMKSMGIEEIGEGRAELLVADGFDIAGILNASEVALQTAVFSDPIGTKIYDAIRRVLAKPIPEYKLAGSTIFFGRGVGVRKLKQVWEATQGNLDKAFDDITVITSIHGFTEVTANKIMNGVKDYREFKKQLSRVITFEEYQKPNTGPWTGKQVVFTGVRSKQAESDIINLGGAIGSSVSSKTSYLVTNDLSNISGKAQRAQDLGIPIITLDELQEMLNNAE